MSYQPDLQDLTVLESDLQREPSVQPVDEDEQWCRVVASSISSVIRFSLNNDFRQECFHLLQATDSRGAEEKLTQKLRDSINPASQAPPSPLAQIAAVATSPAALHQSLHPSRNEISQASNLSNAQINGTQILEISPQEHCTTLQATTFTECYPGIGITKIPLPRSRPSSEYASLGVNQPRSLFDPNLTPALLQLGERDAEAPPPSSHESPLQGPQRHMCSALCLPQYPQEEPQRTQYDGHCEAQHSSEQGIGCQGIESSYPADLQTPLQGSVYPGLHGEDESDFRQFNTAPIDKHTTIGELLSQANMECSHFPDDYEQTSFYETAPDRRDEQYHKSNQKGNGLQATSNEQSQGLEPRKREKMQGEWQRGGLCSQPLQPATSLGMHSCPPKCYSWQAKRRRTTQ